MNLAINETEDALTYALIEARFAIYSTHHEHLETLHPEDRLAFVEQKLKEAGF